MPESVTESLNRANLSGAYQVHVAPQLLVIDLRAHQVCIGFKSDFDTLTEYVHRVLPDYNLGKPSDHVIIPAQETEHAGGVAGLSQIVDRLLGPGGCPWDQAQTHDSLKKYLLEESYELFQAIDQADESAIREELGDVLLQPVMHTQIKRLEGKWGLEEVANEVIAKLIRRHPHVFGDVSADTPEEVLKNWDAIKRQEKGIQTQPASTLAGIPATMPALMLAMEVSKRAARAGFEWPNIDGVWDKFREEELEFHDALRSGQLDQISAELGDLLFTVVNLARWSKVDPEDALRTMVERFRSRFIFMEQLSPKPLCDLSPSEWDDLWKQAKSHSE